MEKSTIIKLRQGESNNVETNGCFSVTLKEGVKLDEGDVVKVHTIVLDTATESIIQLDSDIRITMGVAKYFRNYIHNVPIDYTQDPAATPMPDLKLNFMAHTSTTGNDDYVVRAIYSNPFNNNITADFGGLTIYFQYTEIGTEIKKTVPIIIPSRKIINHMSKAVIDEFVGGPLLVRGKSLVCVTSRETLRKHRLFQYTKYVDSNDAPAPVPDNLIDSGVLFGNNGNPIANTAKTMNIYEEELVFTIEKGPYQPAEIAQIFNDKMTDLKASGSIGYDVAANAYPVNNPFLATIAQINHKIGLLTGAPNFVVVPAGTTDAPVPSNQITFNTIPTTNANDRFVGANQVNMNFDTNLKKMNFDIIHFPVYAVPAGSTTGVPAIVYPSGNLQPLNTEPIPTEPQISSGGIAFTKLVSEAIVGTDEDGNDIIGEHTDFFQQIGLEAATLPVTHSQTVITLGDGSTVYPIVITPVLGGNITGALGSIDIVVPKTADFLTPFIGPTETTLTTPIIGNREFDSVENDEGYYLLQVGFKFPQKMIGGYNDSNLGSNTTSNTVQSIVGKFYTSNNFLQQQGAGEIVYSHQGTSQMINDLNVRVLHADMSPPDQTELGPKNSVFIEIIKAVQPAIPEKEI